MRPNHCSILHNNKPIQPIHLWELDIGDNLKLKHALSEDFRYLRLNNDPFDTDAGFHVSDFDAALHAIDDSLNEISNGQSSLATFQLPQP